MKKITLTAKRYNSAIMHLSRFFEYDKLTPICNSEIARLETSIDITRLHKAYNLYIDDDTDATDCTIDTLILVSHVLRKDNLGKSPNLRDTMSDWSRADLLQLYMAAHEESERTSWVSVRTVNGTVKLRNFCNWFMDDMVKNYLRKNLSDVTSTEQAIKELRRIKGHRGRIPTDPRISILLWGTYSLIKEYHEFKSPMPNRLCQFIIAYLQVLDILPTDTEIDTFWIRAQLRYIRSKKDAASKS